MSEYLIVIIICIILFFCLFICLGARFKRLRNSTNSNELAKVEVPSLTPLETIDMQAINAIKSWQIQNPPNTNQYIDVRQQPDVLQKGVLAWKFTESENVTVIDDIDTICRLQFTQKASIMTNLPVPGHQELSYWEVKVLQLNDARLAIGLATKPYPTWTLPGFHSHSIAYHSNTGSVFTSDPVYGRPYGPSIKEGDVLGIGYLSQSGTVFFTRNGKNLGKASIGFRYPVYPIVGSFGSCQVSVNFGYEDFLFQPANQREAAFASREGSLLPPPAYGGHLNDTLFTNNDSSSSIISISSETHLTYQHVQQPPPSYH